MLFNVVIEQTGGIRFSPALEMDKPMGGITQWLTPGLPLEALERYVGSLSGAEGTQEILRRVRKGLRNDGSALGEQLAWLDNGELPAGGPERLDPDGVLKMWEGRQVSEGELALMSKHLNVSQEKIVSLMHQEVLEGRGQWIPAVKREGPIWRCHRCGSTEVQEWPSFYGQAATCQGCLSIGAMTSLQVFFRLKRGEIKPGVGQERVSGEWNYSFEFSAAQRRAAEELLAYAGRQGAREVLIWAACGAGKTEVCFPFIRRSLGEGKRVLFAAPRQDVVHDLHNRLTQSFSEYRVGIWSGAVHEWEYAQLMVATTHQILKFYQAFDVIIFDETDAYPYDENEVLEYGMKQALDPNGQMVYLTATPSESLLQRTSRNECMLIRLPARFHGQPVPVPEVIKSKLPEYNSASEQILNSGDLLKMRDLMEEMTMEGPLLIFVPVVAMVQEWVKALGRLFAGKVVEGSWGADPDRRRKVSDFISGGSDIFVCTSILERGITVDRVQILILYAHHELFDVRTLVQMAGRTGRTAKNPSGRAILIAPQVTKSMLTAIDWIREQNILAGKGGFLNVREN